MTNQVNQIGNVVETTQAKEVLTKKDTLWKVSPSLLVIDEEFNIRVDYGDIDSLALSIIENGLKMPLSGYRKGEEFVVTDGFRRHRAIKRAMEMGHEVKFVPFFVEPRGYNQEERIFDMFIKNDGKNLTSLEQAELFKKLMARGYTNAQISKKIGKSTAYVTDMLQVANVPQVVKNEIIEGNISASLVSDIAKAVSFDEEKIVEVIEEAKAKNKADGKEKITAKDIKNNSVIAKVKNVVKIYYVIKSQKSETELEELFTSSDVAKVTQEYKRLLNDDNSKEYQVNLVQESEDVKTILGSLYLNMTAIV